MRSGRLARPPDMTFFEVWHMSSSRRIDRFEAHVEKTKAHFGRGMQSLAEVCSGLRTACGLKLLARLISFRCYPMDENAPRT